jgi:hypothetical protein
VNPHVGAGPPNSLISDPTSLAISGVLDATYAALQIEIAVSLALDRQGPKVNARRALIDHLLSDIMLSTIAPLARMLAIDLPRAAGQPAADTRRAGPVFSPPLVTGGELPLLLQAWREATDTLEARLHEAQQHPDPDGTLAGVLGTVQEDIDTKPNFLLVTFPYRCNTLIYQKYRTPARRPMCP